MAAVLAQAGNSLVNGSFTRPMGPSTLGVRSLREEYMKPSHRGDIVRNLKFIEERLGRQSYSPEPVASEERLELPRFSYLFKGDELLPPIVFVSALELGEYETINSKQMPYDADVLILRDNLVASYKPLVSKIRQLCSKEIDDLPPRMVLNFARAWTQFEGTWLRNREIHAVEALQPLAKAIIALEPLLISHKKQQLLPWPRIQHQKGITMKCLEGFAHALAELAGSILPSLQRELDHDPRLLLLMDHVLQLQPNGPPIDSCLTGLSTTPEVGYPDHVGPAQAQGVSMMQPARDVIAGGKDTTLDAYAFKFMGLSSGDAAAAKKLAEGIHSGPSLHDLTGAGKPAGSGTRLEDLSKRAVGHAAELLGAFEAVKDMLLSLKSTLEYIDPALDKDEVFVGNLVRLEKCFKKSKKLYLSPENLA